MIKCPACDIKVRNWQRLSLHVLYWCKCDTTVWYNKLCWCRNGPYYPANGMPAERMEAWLEQHLESVGAENLETHYLLSKLGALHGA